MFVIKRNQIIVCAIAVLVAVAGYLNFSYGRVDNSAAVSENVGEIHLVEEEGDFFEAARLEREISRAQTTETLSALSKSEGDKAGEEIVKVALLSEKEQLCESLIKAKGYEDAVVYINGDKANAVIKSDSLTEEDATKIAAIITEQTGIVAQSIKITASK